MYIDEKIRLRDNVPDGEQCDFEKFIFEKYGIA